MHTRVRSPQPPRRHMGPGQKHSRKPALAYRVALGSPGANMDSASHFWTLLRIWASHVLVGGGSNGRRPLRPRPITPLPVREHQLPEPIRRELLGADWPMASFGAVASVRQSHHMQPSKPGSSTTTCLNNKSSRAGSSWYFSPPSHSHLSQIMSETIAVCGFHSGRRRVLPALAQTGR